MYMQCAIIGYRRVYQLNILNRKALFKLKRGQNMIKTYIVRVLRHSEINQNRLLHKMFLVLFVLEIIQLRLLH